MRIKRKILIFIDYEMILRHFIVNETFKELSNNFDIVYVFNNDRHDFKYRNIVKKNINSKDIRITRVQERGQDIGSFFI